MEVKTKGGGGGVLTALETIAPPPFFGHGQPLVLPSPNVQPPLFVEAQGQPFKLSLSMNSFC